MRIGRVVRLIGQALVRTGELARASARPIDISEGVFILVVSVIAAALVTLLAWVLYWRPLFDLLLHGRCGCV